jgi:Tfx family DNA-binding protein
VLCLELSFSSSSSSSIPARRPLGQVTSEGEDTQARDKAFTRVPRSRGLGFLTEKQFAVLSLRGKGFSQREISKELGLSRASVSMIEGRALKKVRRARETLDVYELTMRSQHKVIVEVGVRLQQIPMIVLQEADRHHIHLKSNMVDILRMVKKQKPKALSEGRTTEALTFAFNERGKVSLLSEDEL